MSRLLAATLIIGSVGVGSAQPWTTNNLPPGCVAWWEAEGNAADSTANRYDGTATGGVDYAAGWIGSAFSFDGNSGVVTVPDSEALRLTNALTIEFRAKRRRFGIDLVLEKGGDWNTGNPNYGVGLHVVNNRMFYFFFDGGWRGTSGVDDFDWHHYAVVATNGAVNPTLYIDGIARPIEFAEGAPTLSLAASSLPLHLGAQVFSIWNYFGNNLLDAVRLYNRALTAGEVAGLHVGPLPAGLVSWWRGEGGTADHQQRHHGTAEGGLAYTNGVLGQAFAFNGTDAAVAMGNWFALQEFTLCLWVKPAAIQQTYADLLDNNHTGARSWVLQHANAADPDTWLWHAGPDAERNFNLASSRWQHVVVTRDANRISRIYRDARLVGMVTNSSAIDYDGSQSLHLGRWTAGGRYFQGSVDEVMVYDRALSPEEVTLVFASVGGQPTLTIQPDGGNVRLTWPITATAFRPERAFQITSGPVTWTGLFLPTPGNNLHHLLVEPSTSGSAFYRLRRP